MQKSIPCTAFSTIASRPSPCRPSATAATTTTTVDSSPHKLLLQTHGRSTVVMVAAAATINPWPPVASDVSAHSLLARECETLSCVE